MGVLGELYLRCVDAVGRMFVMALNTAATKVSPLSTLANVGKATLGDFALLGIATRAQLARRDAYRLYEKICALTQARHDPCVIDVFLATISECRGNPPQKWWAFTPARKAALLAKPTLAPTATRIKSVVTQSAGASRSRLNRGDRAARRSQSQGVARRSSK